MFTTRRAEVRGAGLTLGRNVIVSSRSLEPMDTASPGPILALGAQPYRSADAQQDALTAAKLERKRAAIEAAKAEAAKRVADKVGGTTPTTEPAQGEPSALDSPVVVLIALGIVAWLVLRK